MSGPTAFPAAAIVSGTIDTARLGSGTANSTTYLRGDQSWQSISAGIGGSTGSVDNRILRADGAGGSTVQAGAAVTLSDTGRISAPLGLAETESFGATGTAHAYSTLMGYDATSTGSGVAVCFGGSSSAYSQAVAFGYSATASGLYSCSLGNYTTASYGSSIALGRGTVTTKANQLVIGTGDNATDIGAVSELSLGGGTRATPYTVIYTGCAGSGTNIAGSTVVYSGGRGTGSAAGGSVKIQVAPAGASGSSQNALADALVIDSTKVATFSGPATFAGPVRLGIYTFATVPTASSYTNYQITISDRAARSAYSDGTNWRFCADDAIIS